MAPPGTKHQRLVHVFDRGIGNYIQRGHGECEVFPAPFAVFLNENGRDYVEPDLSVICSRDKITEKGCKGAPDWIIEVVSPSSRQMDYFKKLFKYRTAGVRKYWAAGPERELVAVCHFEKDSMEEYAFGEDIPVGIYEGFSIKAEQ